MEVVDPFDGLEPGPGGTRELIGPAGAREALETPVGRGAEPPLHDADARQPDAPFLRRACHYSGRGGMIMLEWNSSRSRKGNRSSRGFETNVPSGRCIDETRGM